MRTGPDPIGRILAQLDDTLAPARRAACLLDADGQLLAAAGGGLRDTTWTAHVASWAQPAIRDPATLGSGVTLDAGEHRAHVRLVGGRAILLVIAELPCADPSADAEGAARALAPLVAHLPPIDLDFFFGEG